MARTLTLINGGVAMIFCVDKTYGVRSLISDKICSIKVVSRVGDIIKCSNGHLYGVSIYEGIENLPYGWNYEAPILTASDLIQ